MTKRTKKTSDGMAILDAIAGKDPEVQALTAEAAENLRIARNIYELRTKAGLSQTELAKRIGTTQSVISRLGTQITRATPWRCYSALQLLWTNGLNFDGCHSAENQRWPSYE